MYEIVNQLLRHSVLPTQKMISNLIMVELAYINTSHPDFIGGKQAVAQLNRKLNPNETASRTATAVPATAGNGGSSSIATAGNASGNSSALPQTPSTTSGASNVVPPSPPTANSNGSTPSSAASAAAEVPGGGFFGLFKPSSANVSNPVGNTAAVSGTRANSSSGSQANQHLNSRLITGGVVTLPPVCRRYNVHPCCIKLLILFDALYTGSREDAVNYAAFRP